MIQNKQSMMETLSIKYLMELVRSHVEAKKVPSSIKARLLMGNIMVKVN